MGEVGEVEPVAYDRRRRGSLRGIWEQLQIARMLFEAQCPVHRWNVMQNGISMSRMWTWMKWSSAFAVMSHLSPCLIRVFLFNNRNRTSTQRTVRGAHHHLVSGPPDR